MARSDVERRLAAILCADVAGYSRLMGADEEATVETLTAFRSVFVEQIGAHRGRIVDAKGDAILAEFASVADAVLAAVAVQTQLGAQNEALPEGRRMHFRIGINLGDVVVKEDVIYGDGVNVAARLEGLADPGGVCISRAVHDQVKDRLALEFEDLGEQQVKNIARPVAAFRIRDLAGTPVESSGAAGAGSPAAPPPGPGDRPSLAVLPFANMSGDPEQEYFNDGLTEDIITDLSRLHRLTVIARNSVFVYKNRPTDVRQVGRELGVRYVLEGSVRKAGDRLRITAQLVETTTGNHLWAERFDRELKDIFALQDEITRHIAAELEVNLLEGEQARVWRRLTDQPEAYDLTLQGRDLFRRYNRADVLRGRRLLERAVALDPGFSYAVAELGWSYVVEGNLVSGDDVARCYAKAVELGQQAIALDDTLSEGHALLATALRFQGQIDRAIECGLRAVDLNPSDTDAIQSLCQSLLRVGRNAEAVQRMEAALPLVPHPPASFLGVLGFAYRAVGRFDEALALLHRGIEQAPDNIRMRLGLTITYMQTGQAEAAREQARQVLRLNPDFRVSTHPVITTYADAEIRRVLETLLLDAGLPR